MVTFAWAGHRRRLRLLVHAALLGIWAAAEAGVLAAWRSTPSSISLGIAAAAWGLVGPLLLWNGFRRGNGRESLAVRPPFLIHTRVFGPFTWRRTYDLGEVLRPRASRVSVPPLRRYRVEFDYRGWGRRFGGQLSAAEAECIVAMILRAQDPERF